MTPYENATLALAQSTFNLQVVSVAISAAALVAAIVAGVTIWLQLRASQWNALLQFEMDLNGRWRDFSAIALEMQNTPSLTEEQRSLLKARFDVLKESYLNAVDRLASSILNGQFPDRKLRPDYRGFIEEALRNFPDAYGPGTRLRNTARLHDRWSK